MVIGNVEIKLSKCFPLFCVIYIKVFRHPHADKVFKTLSASIGGVKGSKHVFI